jgi:L-serine dehydratase
MNGAIDSVVIDYDPNGSLVTTHESQGTDMGLYGGLMGWKADDPRMTDYQEYMETSGINVQVNYLDYNAEHPNNYRINCYNHHTSHSIQAISTGGGMITIHELDGSKVEINGDYHELIIYGDVDQILSQIEPISFDLFTEHHGFIKLQSTNPYPDDVKNVVKSMQGVNEVCLLYPVLPVLSRKDLRVPFSTCAEMIQYGSTENLNLWELALVYESQRGAISQDEVFEQMSAIASIMKAGIEEGLAGTSFEDRILPVQSGGFMDRLNGQQLLDGGMLNWMILYTTAMMEVKSSMGVFVAAPTAGSCGVLPGSIFGAAKVLKSTEDEIVRALLSAGMMGVFIAEHATFAAEVAGCQAETGAGGSMAAAGLVTLMNGSLEQCITASSMALQNSLGIVCDPIGNRVEAPCLGKNVMAASNALSCSNMALSGYDGLIPFDEVVQSMKEVGDMMAHELTCTGLGGLAATPTAKAIEARLREKAKYC